MQAQNSTVYTVRIHTATERKAGIDHPDAGVQVCLIGNKSALMHRIGQLEEATDARDMMEEICKVCSDYHPLTSQSPWIGVRRPEICAQKYWEFAMAMLTRAEASEWACADRWPGCRCLVRPLASENPGEPVQSNQAPLPARVGGRGVICWPGPRVPRRPRDWS